MWMVLALRGLAWLCVVWFGVFWFVFGVCWCVLVCWGVVFEHLFEAPFPVKQRNLQHINKPIRPVRMRRNGVRFPPPNLPPCLAIACTYNFQRLTSASRHLSNPVT